MDSAFAQRRRRKVQHQMRNGQLVYNTAKTYLGKPTRKHQDWFGLNDQELQTLMSRRDQAHQRVLQTKSTRSTTEVRLMGKDGRELLTETT